MKYKKFLLLLLLVLLLQGTVSAEDSSYLVKFKESLPEDLLTQDFREIHAPAGLYEISSMNLLQGLEDYVVYVEPNGSLELIDPDPLLLLMSGEEPQEEPQPQIKMIGAETLWQYQTFGNGINVALIDSGCNPHKELDGCLKGGYNYLTKTEEYADNYNHGTHVAGIIAAQHNGYGVCGIAPKVNLYALKCVDTNASSVSALVDAIYDAVDVYDCQVINMSLGTIDNFTSLADAVKYAYEQGVILVAAVGNEGISRLWYPAGYPEVIGVGSVDLNKVKVQTSQTNNSVHIVTSGGKVLSTGPNQTYIYMGGTSQAAPQVAGAAAAFLSVNPDMTPSDFRDLLRDTAEDLGDPGYDTSYGWGFMDMEAMFHKVLGDTPCYIAPPDQNTLTIFNRTDAAINHVLGLHLRYTDQQRFTSLVSYPLSIPAGDKTTIVTLPIEKGLSKFTLVSALDTLTPLSNQRVLTKSSANP